MTPTCCTDHCDHNQIMVGLNNKINEEESLSEFSWELGNRIFFSVHIFAKLGKWNVTSHYQFSASLHIYTSWHTRGSFHNRNILFGGSKIHTMIRILVSDSLCLFCVLLTLHLTNVIAYHIECIFPKNSEVGVVSGISGIEEFSDFLIRCGDKDTEILRYTECYIGQISLPVRKILNNYPSLRIIYGTAMDCVVTPSTSVIRNITPAYRVVIWVSTIYLQ